MSSGRRAVTFTEPALPWGLAFAAGAMFYVSERRTGAGSQGMAGLGIGLTASGRSRARPGYNAQPDRGCDTNALQRAPTTARLSPPPLRVKPLLLGERTCRRRLAPDVHLCREPELDHARSALRQVQPLQVIKRVLERNFTFYPSAA